MRYDKFAIALAIIVALSFGAYAQNAIDNNLQVGSGGVNSPQPQNTYNSGNDIVTGNVGGGKQFRGNINYRATGEFGGNTGTNDLYQFRANTTPYTQPGYLPTPRVNRSNAGVRLEDVGNAQSPADLLLPSAAGETNMYQLQVDPGATLGNPNAAAQLNTIGVVRSNDGRLLEMQSSTLTGVRTRTVDGQSGTVNRNMGTRQQVGSWTPYDLPAPPSTGLDNSLNLGRPEPTVGMTEGLYSNSRPQDGMGYSRQVDNSIDMRDSRGGLAAKGRTLDARVMQLQAQRTSVPAGFQVEPGEDAYMSLIQQERARVNLAIGKEEPTKPEFDPNNQMMPRPDETQGPAINQLLPRPSADSSDADAAENQGTGDQLFDDLKLPSMDGEATTQQPTDDADAIMGLDLLDNTIQQNESGLNSDVDPMEQQRIDQQQRLNSRGIQTPIEPKPLDDQPQNSTGFDNTLGTDPLGTNTSNDSGSMERLDFNADITNLVQPKKMDVTSLDLNTVEVMSLSVDKQGRIVSEMQQAESELRAGQFYEAEGGFRNAEAAHGDLPMASVGKIHAQLGSGQIRTAAVNMRTFFDRYPQLAANRYNASLLPSSKWIDIRTRQLKRMIDDTDNKDAGMLYAYLGHQLEDREMVQYGLAAMEKSQAGTTLMSLLKRAWLQ